jgi:hypothetical protein
MNSNYVHQYVLIRLVTKEMSETMAIRGVVSLVGHELCAYSPKLWPQDERCPLLDVDSKEEKCGEEDKEQAAAGAGAAAGRMTKVWCLWCVVRGADA